MLGKKYRLSRIISSENNKTIIVPIDDSLISGPVNGLFDLEEKTNQVSQSKANAILCFTGTLKSYSHNLHNLARIVNITASTIRHSHTKKVLVSSVENAVSLGADAVAVHINLGSMFESEMISNMGMVSEQCEKLGTPLVGIMYPRGERNGQDDNYTELKEKSPDEYSILVQHAVRLGVELGADLVKTQYTGSPESFSKVIESAGTTPVVIAGGPKREVLEMFKIADEAISAGASGVSFGRNVFNRKNSTKIIDGLSEIVFNNSSAEEVFENFN